MTSKKKLRGNKNMFLVFVCLVTILVIFVGYFSFVKTYNRKKTNTPIPIDDLTASQVQFVDKDLPSGLPTDFPIYPNSTVDSSWGSETKQTRGISFLLKTADSVESVSSYYRKNLLANGYRIDSEFENNGSLTISFSKEKIVGFIGVTKAGETNISVTLGVEI